MYFYLYDSFLQNAKYSKELDRMETRLMDMGIGGKIGKLSLLKNAKEFVREALKKGAQNIICVGNDQTLASVFEVVAEQNATLGYIPIEGEGAHRFANMIGMPFGEASCDILSKRMIAQVDIGRINETLFLFYVEAEKNDVVIQSEKGYKIIPLEKKSRVLICNCNYLPELHLQKKDGLSFTSGVLYAIVAPLAAPKTFLGGLFANKRLQKKAFLNTIIPFSEMTLTSNIAEKGEEIALTVDERKVIKTPAKISVVPAGLKLIVGKNRQITE